MKGHELIKQVEETGEGAFLPFEFSAKTFDASDVRKWLEKHGYTVVSNKDTGRMGVAETSEGICVSTNGFVWKKTTGNEK